jgi:hypothetical protein
MSIQLTWDEGKRKTSMVERGLDFSDAHAVFLTATVEFEDTRENYGEKRMICYGFFNDRLLVVGYVKRGNKRHIFSMRKANEREKTKFGQ